MGQDGTAYKLADLDQVAYHAGCGVPNKNPKGCIGMNSKTIGISYTGGIEGGQGAKNDKGNLSFSVAQYQRTWEEWQTSSLDTPFCKKGIKKGICNNDGKWGISPTISTAVYNFKPKAQWANMVNSILYAKLKHPQIKFITSHHFHNTHKGDVGNNFPWSELLAALQKGGWNKKDAGNDPYLITEWKSTLGKIIKKDKLNQGGSDWVITNAELQEMVGSKGTTTNTDPTSATKYRKNKKCVIEVIPADEFQEVKVIDDKMKELRPKWNKAVRSGILANMFKESSFNLNAYTADGAECGSYGLVQWRKERQDNLFTYTESIGLSYSSLEGQLSFMISELESNAYKKKLGDLSTDIQDSKDGAEQMAYLWARHYHVC